LCLKTGLRAAARRISTSAMVRPPAARRFILGEVSKTSRLTFVQCFRRSAMRAPPYMRNI
jgi:hypothetical protein